MTDDIVYDDSGWPQTMRCHAQVRELLRDALGHSSLVTTDRPGRRGAYPSQLEVDSAHSCRRMVSMM
jgi:hypothetical protein